MGNLASGMVMMVSQTLGMLDIGKVTLSLVRLDVGS